MDANRSARLFALLLIAVIAAAFCVVAFTDPAPGGKPRKLTPAEQRDSLKPKKKIAEV